MHNFQSNFIFMMKFITFFNETPLLIAAKLNNLKIVELLLEKKEIDIYKTNKIDFMYSIKLILKILW